MRLRTNARISTGTHTFMHARMWVTAPTATRHTCTKNTESVTGLFNGRERTGLLEGAQFRPPLPPPKEAACPLCRFQFATPLTPAALLRHQGSAACIRQTAALRERAASRETARATAANARKPGRSGQPPFPYSSLTNSLTSDLDDAPGGVDFLPPSHDTLASSSVASLSGSNSNSSNAQPANSKAHDGFQVGGLSVSIAALKNTRFDRRHETELELQVVNLGKTCFHLANELNLPLQGLPNTHYRRSDTGRVQFAVDLAGVCVPAAYALPAPQALYSIRPGILSSTTQSQSIDALNLVDQTLRPVVAVYPTGDAVVFMPGCWQNGGYGNSLCYGHSVASSADVDGLHVLVAALLAQRGSGSTVAIAMVSMRCNLPLTGQTRMSPIFFPRAAGVPTKFNVESWLSMQPASPTVSALLKALLPADSASGGGVYHPASDAQCTELRKLLSAHLVASGKVPYDRAEFDHSVGVSEMTRSLRMLLSHGLAPVTPDEILKSGVSLRLCLAVRKTGHSEDAGCFTNTALNITSAHFTDVLLQQNRDFQSIEPDMVNPFMTGPRSKFSIVPLLRNRDFLVAHTAGMRDGYYFYAARLVEAAAAARLSKQQHMATYLALLAGLAIDQMLRLWYVMDPEAALRIRSTLGRRADPGRHSSLLSCQGRVRCSAVSVPEEIAPLGLVPTVTPQTSCVEPAPKEQFQSQLRQLQMQDVPALPTTHTGRPFVNPMADDFRICPPHLLGEAVLSCTELLAPKNVQPLCLLPTVSPSSPQSYSNTMVASAMPLTIFSWDEVSTTPAPLRWHTNPRTRMAHPSAHERTRAQAHVHTNEHSDTRTHARLREHMHVCANTCTRTPRRRWGVTLCPLRRATLT